MLKLIIFPSEIKESSVLTNINCIDMSISLIDNMFLTDADIIYDGTNLYYRNAIDNTHSILNALHFLKRIEP